MKNLFKALGTGWRPREGIGLAVASVVGGAIGILVMLGIKAYQVSGPPLHITRIVGTEAELKGTELRVPADVVRKIPPCFGGYSNRQIMHYPDGVRPETGNFDFVAPVLERSIVISKPGEHKYTILLHLAGPMPHFASGSLYYDANIFNGCSLWDRVFGGGQPISIPPTPVREVR